MPGPAATEIVVAPGGVARVAPVGTAAPVDEVTAPAVAWVDLGYASEDGATFHFEGTVEEIPAWQALYPVRRIRSAEAASLSLVLRQWNKVTLPLAFGGGTVTTVSAGHYKYSPRASTAGPDERSFMLDWIDGTKHYRLILVKALQSDAVDSQLVRNAAADLPITMNVEGADTGDSWYLLTDDPAFL